MVKFFLIFVLFTPDGGGYQDLVFGFDTEAQCLAAQEEAKRVARQSAPGAYFAAQCVRPSALNPVRS